MYHVSIQTWSVRGASQKFMTNFLPVDIFGNRRKRHNLARITSRGVIVTCMQSMHLTDYCVWEFTVIIKRTGIKFGHLKIKSFSRYVKSVIKISIYLVAKFPSTKTCLHEVYVDLNYVNFHDYFCMRSLISKCKNDSFLALFDIFL